MPGVEQKVTPADTLVSLILAPYVLDQAEKDGKGISESQARAAVKEIKNPAPATLEFVRTSLAANGLSEQARRGRPGRGRQGRDHRQPPLRHARPQEAAAHAPGAQLDQAGRTLGHGDPAGPGHRGSAAVVAARLSLLLSTPRIAPGLLSREAWSTLERAGQVLGRDADEPQLLAIEDAGVSATALGDVHPAELARLLVDRATEADVVWVGSSDGDPGLTDALAAEVSRRDDPPEVEMLVGSYDVPGSRAARPGRRDGPAALARRLPVGRRSRRTSRWCPTSSRRRTRRSRRSSPATAAHMAEELGDVLLQVVFHARVAQEHPDAPFGIDDVAGGIVEKLVRRHPHVFADVDADTAAEVSVNWEQIKAEREGRAHGRAGRHTGRAARPGAGRQGGLAAAPGRPVARSRSRRRAAPPSARG